MKVFFSVFLIACGTTSTTLDGGGSDAVAPIDASASDASGPSAATTTASQNATCAAIAPFYWEIGDVNGAMVSGTTGSGVVEQTTELNIASASKMWWGAYVVERFKSDLTQIDVASMEMGAGRTNFGDCTSATTVDDCCAKAGADGGTNCDIEQADVGHFFYSGGHFQGYASNLDGGLGLGADDDGALATELASLLGTELSFSYTQPQLAGGMKMSAATYTQFLRKILAGSLALHDHLGENATCTLPGASCPSAHYSPSPLAWHYSYGHWVEDEPTTGDGAFSSPGKFGFYPWIDKTKTFYGVVAREDLLPGDGTIQNAPYYRSVLCGRAIRAAFFTGTPQ